MKRKISVSVDEHSVYKIRESMVRYRHRNKSQAIERFLQRLLEEIGK